MVNGRRIHVYKRFEFVIRLGIILSTSLNTAMTEITIQAVSRLWQHSQLNDTRLEKGTKQSDRLVTATF